MTFPTIGLVGGGHISDLLSSSARSLGINVRVLAANPVAGLSTSAALTRGDESDVKTLLDFSKECACTLFERAEVPRSLVKTLSASGVLTYPTLGTCDAIASLNADAPTPKSSEELFTIAVARSAHNQAAIWPASSLLTKKNVQDVTVTPAPNISHHQHLRIQRFFLELAEKINLIGVMEARFGYIGDEVLLYQLLYGPQGLHSWSIEGSKTNVYEQHVRALLDLPLGSPESIYPSVVSATLYNSKNGDLYRPYLHLMARNPELKFHQYRYSADGDRPYLHLTLTGADHTELIAEIDHACSYISGEIDE